ncbi:hypothetical protein BDA96_01G224800 [Sorghum bicolor]|uniref:HNH nuclease domain-containing protein n=2 Tax=Sorghum bicolor TaxID=4558 RepID=A0A921UYI8_SORBI|nr:hypothetical protein BDA96_01G224800 [Sorghum bicolor]OQU91591.1 hypothetical protein SORBI_3001G210700 [Sorghum bicolor]
MGGPTSPRRENDGEGSGRRSPAQATEKERPRSFDEKTRTACWRKAAVLAGRHPERWRLDAVGNVVCRRFWGCHGCLCYEYDHIVPFSKDQELDIIEMAVYGDVIRPGKQCRCKTVAEMLGQVKSMNRMAACELPDKGAS